jgi:poly-gamma-glutamate capsule biosynthesis protein CapA/YwtB (metallophosphatase superfamily)
LARERDGAVTLFLCGDVMLGRGVDQILPHPGDPALREAYVHDARSYVEFAEAVNGPIPRPAGFSWPWGDALRAVEEFAPDVRVVNLETSITTSDDFAPAKGVHYRMSPANLSSLLVARPDACVLANNHVLDFGYRGLEDTLRAASQAGLQVVGAGRDTNEARRPTIVAVDGGSRVLVFSFGMMSSGIPETWAATDNSAGVDLVPVVSDAMAAEVGDRVRRVKRPGDIAIASVHWGSNWGYKVAADQVRFAHKLIDDGFDVVHGHSSHHPRPVEVYHDRLILYGCGDLINDYEGITGYQQYRDDLRLLYFVSVRPRTGELLGLRLVPMQARKLRLRHASRADSTWLRVVLDRVSHRFGTRINTEPDGVLALER